MAVWRNALHRSPTGKLGRHSARAHERTNARTHCTFAIGHELRRLKSPSPPLRPPPPPQLNPFLESRGYQPLYFAAATRAESRRLQHQPVDSHTPVPDGNVGGRDAATTVTAWQRTPTAGRLDSRTAPPPTVVGAQSGTARPARQANSYPKSRPQHGENPALQRARPTPAPNPPGPTAAGSGGDADSEVGAVANDADWDAAASASAASRPPAPAKGSDARAEAPAAAPSAATALAAAGARRADPRLLRTHTGRSRQQHQHLPGSSLRRRGRGRAPTDRRAPGRLSQSQPGAVRKPEPSGAAPQRRKEARRGPARAVA